MQFNLILKKLIICFLKVFLIKDKILNKKYACKTFNKSKVFSEHHGKVIIYLK